MRKNLIFILSCCLFFSLSSNASEWTRYSGSLAYMPAFKPLKGNDIASFKVKIQDKSPYATTGIFLKKGQINLTTNTITAYTGNNIPVPIQFDAQNYYSDQSVRFAIVTIKKPQNIGNDFEVVLKRSTGYSAQKKIRPLKPRIQVQIQNNTVSLEKATVEAKPWRSGSLVDIRRYFAPVTKDFMVEFDVTTFENGMVRSDVVMRYDRLYETPMRSSLYNAEIFVNGKSYKKLNKVRQNHHSKYRIPIRFGYSQENITALNMHKIIDTRALARYDMTYGIDINSIENDYNRLQNANNSINGSSIIEPSFPTTGGRDDIALLPQWTVRYIMTSNEKARKVVLQQGETAAYIPWHFIDKKTNNPPLPKDHPKLRLDGRATISDNGIQGFDTSDTIWELDVAHQPSLSYIPFLITGDRYFYDNLVTAYTWSRFNVANNWGRLRDPMLRTQNFEQVRSYAWLQRLTAEMALVVPDNSPLDIHLKKQMAADVNYFTQAQINGLEYEDGRYGNPTGELYGMLYGFGDDTGRENPLFMQNLAAIGIGFHSLSGVNPPMRAVSSFQTNFISGIFLQKNNGYPPQYGTGYKLMQYVPDENGIKTLNGTIKIYNRWADVFNYSINSGYFNEATQEVQAGKLPGYYEAADSFVSYGRAAQSMLYNVTKDPRAMEAYGFLAQYLPAAEDSYHQKPAYLIVPEFGNGYIPLNRTINGGSGQDNMIAEQAYSLLHGQDGDDFLFLDKFPGVLFGGNGNDTLNAGTADSMLFGGSGSDTLISGLGDDYLKGDENYGKNQDIFVFTQKNFGNDVIADFTPGIDKIKFTPDTRILRFYHDNQLYGLRRNKKEDTGSYRQVMDPDYPEDLSPKERQEYINGILAAAARGDVAAKKKLNLLPQVNIGVEKFIRPDGNGGTYINFNRGRTPDEMKKIDSSVIEKPYGTIHLLNVDMNSLRSDDFIFSE